MSKERGNFTLLLKQAAKDCKVKLVTEHKFLDNRRFKFDFAIPDRMIGIEYEGTMSRKSRHTTVTGYSKDCEKYNLASINGWTVLRYTALNYGDVERDLKQLFNQVK